MSDKRNENTDKKGTCVYEKDIHVSHKRQDAATNREKGQGITRTRAGAAPCKNHWGSQLYLHITRYVLKRREDTFWGGKSESRVSAPFFASKTV
jgi:hypothetical protein